MVSWIVSAEPRLAEIKQFRSESAMSDTPEDHCSPGDRRSFVKGALSAVAAAAMLTEAGPALGQTPPASAPAGGGKVVNSSLLTPANHSLLLIDHQYLQLDGVHSHDPKAVVNSAVMTAKLGKLYGVPTLLTTAVASRQKLHAEVQAVFPEQEPIDRTGLNAWDDARVRAWVANAGRQRLVMTGLWTEVCLNMSVLDAIAAGHETYIITDAAGANSVEGHERAVQRMIQAGARPLTAVAYGCELQRDWANAATAPQLSAIFEAHADTGSKSRH